MNLSNIITKLKDRKPSILGHEQFRKSAVLLPLIEKDDELHILFEVRSIKMRSQPGDICFPGGRIDKEDLGPKHAAIRETTEELGINAAAIKDVIPLDFMASDLGRIIYPFVGRITDYEQIVPNESEVEEVFTVPLSFFLKTTPEKYKVNFKVIPEADFPFDLIIGGENYNWQTHHIEEIFYKYEGRVIWGLTAKILTHFIELLGDE
ncbi:coenzyme A pyrophosphatase [Virgibacillus profundi]|uniref:Coenzyme A pyrophosphatase n=1 Tax=Virgibacillus profundi TaxID=2024555 RepID=A0A2A2IJU1_9BACI|nr:CoA pyrophosphatase [Virgibacillus profundi]PAV31586.1 coenzyme A pyrophosphatase [Virgibacillus profundi]PXY55772.1 CoA pyrophosphatase [Virgibacillus profundi]